MSVDDEYHAHKRRQEALYVLAFDEFEKNLTPAQRRALGSAAVPDVEDPRSHSSRRVSLGVLTDAAERVSASYTPNVTEVLDGTFEDPSPELLAEMLGVPLDLVMGCRLDERMWNPSHELLAETLGVTLDAAWGILDWHNKVAGQKAEKIRMRAIVRIAGVFLDSENAEMATAGLAFANIDLALRNGLVKKRTPEDFDLGVRDFVRKAKEVALAKNVACIVSRHGILSSVKFWRRELELSDALEVQPWLPAGEVRGILAWHNRVAGRKADKIKMRVVERILSEFIDCANTKLTAAGLAYAADLALAHGLGTMQEYALRIAVSRAAISKNAKFWQRELNLPAASNMRDTEKCRAYSEAQKAKHWRNQKCTLVGV
jgi:hypothetical protein